MKSLKLYFFISLLLVSVSFNRGHSDLKNSSLRLSAPDSLINSSILNNVQIDSAIQLINGEALINIGLTGQSVKIGINEVGFQEADVDSSLQHIFNDNRVIAVHDFVNPENKQFYSQKTDMDMHGTYVWRYLAGYNGVAKWQYGLATDAHFYLARTDDGEREYRKEQQYFKAALEWLDSLDVRLVHTSLGYSFGFDNPEENYIPEEMDGKTSAITAATQEAALKAGMIIVTSAGNEGNGIWKIISAPADAENIISVGSTDVYKTKRDFSSEGPDFLPYLKPDISCYNSIGGTSFSAPAITGVIACMLEKKPALSNTEIIEIIEKSGHLYPFGNNYVGYGVPNGDRILKLMENINFEFNRSKKINTTENRVSLEFDNSEKEITIFHKNDKWIVLRQVRVNLDGNVLQLKRPGKIKRSKLVVDDKVNQKFHFEEEEESVTHSTIVSSSKVYEIVWN